MEKLSEMSSAMEAEPTAIKRRRSSDTNGTVKNGTVEKESTGEENYFSSYADIELHRTMIEDQVRTNAYKDAILSTAADYFHGKVVCDVGCGTGILSMFCAQAGAKKVYAIDASKIAKHARQLVEVNGYADVITVFECKAEEVELPEKVDVIVSEWMGYMLLYETMLPSVLHVRDRWLKPGGKMFPEKAVLHMALGEAQWITKYEEGTYDFWVSLNHEHNLDMTLLADHSVARYKDVVHVHMVAQEDVLSHKSTVCDLDLYTVTAKELANITHRFSLSSMGSRKLNSFVLWFDVWFPGGMRLTTSPDDEDTHWQNTVLPLATQQLKQDTKVEGDLVITQDMENHRFLKIDVKYSLDDSPKISRTYKMDDNCNDNDF